MKENTIPYDQLKLQTSEFQNPRTTTGLDEKTIRELADDIEARGLLYPLIVWAPHNLILGGQRRYLAIGLLYGKGLWQGPVPVRITNAATLEEAKAIALADGLHRKNISSFEVAQAIAAMEGEQLEIAKRIGKSASYVNRLLGTWNNAQPALKAAWEAKAIPFDLAREYAKLPEPDQTKKVEWYLHRSQEGTRKARGEARAGFGRPGVSKMRDIDRLPPPVTAYERGVADATQHYLTGITPVDPRWKRYVDG